MMELRIQLIPTGEIILPPGKNGENYCNNCKVSSPGRGRILSFLFVSECFTAARVRIGADTAEFSGVVSYRDEAEKFTLQYLRFKQQARI